ncbi:hypothetical protein NicSoilC12_10280 [Arthrobacter sp. NicSoilC12]|nr:hypothetical protein NicSoilC12_10280 [Arthrobacter sp. NicSoilC12]
MGFGSSSRSIAARITSLSWALTRASGPGWTFTPAPIKDRRCAVGDVFVVEGQDVEAAGELEQMLQVLVVADRGVSHGRDCGDVLAFGENTELKAQGGRGRGHHAGKLAAANNTDYRKSHKSQPTENLTGTRLLGIGKRGNGAGTGVSHPPARRPPPGAGGAV